MGNRKQIFLMYSLISLLFPVILDIGIPFIKILNLSKATSGYAKLVSTPLFYGIDLATNIVYASLLFFLILFIFKNTDSKHVSISVGLGLIVHFVLLIIIYKTFLLYFVLELGTVSLILSSSIFIYFLLLFKQIRSKFSDKKKNEGM